MDKEVKEIILYEIRQNRKEIQKLRDWRNFTLGISTALGFVGGFLQKYILGIFK